MLFDVRVCVSVFFFHSILFTSLLPFMRRKRALEEKKGHFSLFESGFYLTFTLIDDNQMINCCVCVSVSACEERMRVMMIWTR